MSEVFGGEGSGAQRPPQERAEGASEARGERRGPGEGPRGRYVQYDNETGAVMIDLPPECARYKRELEEDLMDAFYGESGGAKDTHRSIDEWVADWLRRKQEEEAGRERGSP